MIAEGLKALADKFVYQNTVVKGEEQYKTITERLIKAAENGKYAYAIEANLINDYCMNLLLKDGLKVTSQQSGFNETDYIIDWDI